MRALERMKRLVGWGSHSLSEEIAAQLTLADKISRLSIHSSGARDIAQRIVGELAALMPIDWAAMALLDKPAQEARVMNLMSSGRLGDDYVVPLAGTPFAWGAETKQVLVEYDLRLRKRVTVNVAGPRIVSVVHMPLFYQGEVFGILTIGSIRPQAYRESDLRLLRHAVVHLGISLKSALLLEQNMRVQSTLNNLNELLQAITSRPELPEVFPQFARRLREIVPFDCLTLLRIEGNVVNVLASFQGNGGQYEEGGAYQAGDSAISWREEGGEVVVKEHLGQGFQGEVRVPLYAQGKLLAGLHLMSRQPYSLKEELVFLQQLAGYLATPVQAYILYSYEKQRLDWFAALGHHVRNPLSAVVSSSKLLAGTLRQGSGGTLGKLADNVYAGAQNLNRSLRLFWDLSEVETPGLSLELESVDLGPFLVQAAGEVMGEAEDRSQSLVTQLPETLSQTWANPARIKQALHILLQCAVQASPERGQVLLRAGETGLAEGAPTKSSILWGVERGQPPALIVEVSDSGQAFLAEERERLLRPYRLSEADRTSFPELTLNLAIVRRIVELHGGRFWIESEPGKGNTYGFSLPVVKSR